MAGATRRNVRAVARPPEVVDANESPFVFRGEVMPPEQVRFETVELRQQDRGVKIVEAAF